MFPRTDRPPILANWLHSLVSRLPFGVPSSALLAAPFGAAVLPGFHPSSRHHRWRPQARAFPGFRSVPSSGFLNLSTVCATLGFAGLLHPAATSRVPPFRGFSRPTASPARRQLVPPCRSCPSARRRTGCHPRTRRLRGLAPWTDAFLRVGGWPSLRSLPSSVSSSLRYPLPVVDPVPRGLHSGVCDVVFSSA
jgi:hypothetical protein